MLGLASFLLLSFIIGVIARALMSDRDLGPGLTLVVGAAAQIVGWVVSLSMGPAGAAQPWAFMLSVGAACVLLYIYEETAPRARQQPGPEQPALQRPAPRAPRPPLWRRLALAPAWAAAGALLLGATGFVIGFFGPMRFQPWANQGPLVGLFLTGPGGVLLGAAIGGGLSLVHPEWTRSRRVWTLNAANALWALFVLDLVADRRWWA
jgi:uncharacterized membrane protein YeaQ/YmgE (transglycosylase-associated protein family)